MSQLDSHKCATPPLIIKHWDQKQTVKGLCRTKNAAFDVVSHSLQRRAYRPVAASASMATAATPQVLLSL